MENEIYIGQLIKEKLKENGQSVQWLSAKLCCSRQNIYRIFKSRYLDTEQLERISLLLHYDFFPVFRIR